MTRALRTLLVLPTGLLALSLLSCGRDVTGPEGGPFGRTASLALMPELPAPMVVAGSGDVVAFTRVRAILLRADNTELLSQVVDFPADADEVPLTLSVPLPVNTPASGLPLRLLLRYVNAAGDTVFAGGPVPVVAVPIGNGTGQPQPVAIILEWVGPGSNAASVELSPPTGSAVSGTQTTFAVTVRDGQGQPMTGVPVVFSTPDPTRATVTASSATVSWLPVRGSARIIATLPSGLVADTATIDVTLPASQLTIVSGNAQTATYGTTLAAPLVVRALASDGVPVPGVEVTFAVASGGGTISAAVDTTDGNGDAGTTWTLGATLGAQSVTATFTGLAQPVTFTATATAGAGTTIVAGSYPAGLAAGEVGVFQPEVQDADGNRATGFNGPLTIAIASGPAGGVLGGTTTRDAVNGLATFDDLFFNVRGLYDLVITSPGLTPAAINAYPVGAGPVAALVVVSGDAQSGAPGAALPQPVVVRAQDAFGNGVTATVGFAVTGGGGSVTPASAATDGNSQAQTAWTLGATPGAQTMRASIVGTPTVFVDVTANAAVPGGGLRTWTGGTSTAWDLAANWLGGLVPTSLDTVLVTAAATFDPVLSTDVVISGLTIEDGASLAIGDFILSVVGSLVAPTTPSITLGAGGGLGLQGTTGTVRGALPTTIVTGSYGMSGPVSIGGDLSIGAGSLVVNAYPLTVSGDLITGGTGALGMTGPVDVTVGGDAFFAGGSTAGLLTAGRLFIGGAFTQGGGAPNAFSASSGHETWFSSATPQDIQFLNPGFGVEFSHFGTLYGGQPSGSQLTLLSDVYVDGLLETGVAVNRKVFQGTGGRIISRGADIDANGIQFVGLPWEIVAGGSITNIQNVLFSAMDPTVTQFRIARATGGFSMSGLTFATAPTTGRYLELEDVAPTDGNVLTATVSGVSPAQYPPGTVALIGGAVLNGWSAAPNFTWTGAVSADWATGGNWSGGAVPTAADSVFIAAGTPNAPAVNTPAEARTVVLADNATLALATANLTVSGSVSAGTGASVTAGDGRLVLTGGGTIRGALGRISVNGGSYALAGAVTAGTGVEVYDGDLSIGAHTLDASSLFVGLDGTITMTDAAGLLVVGDVTIDGASTAGRLTAGTMRVRGGFFQESSQSDQSFAASGAHVVELAGPVTQRVRLRSPDSTATAACAASCFATLRAVKPAGSGGLDVESSLKALAGFDLQADSVSTTTLQGLQLVSGGGARFDTPVLRVSGIAWRTELIQNATTVAVDSLIAWGTGAGLVNIPGVRTTVAGTHAIRTPITGSVDVTGTLDVDGAAGISGNLRTLGAGRLRMTEAADSLQVNGAAIFSGGPTSGLLTAGTLRVGSGLFSPAPSVGAFAAGGAHRTRLFDGCALCDGLQLTLADTSTTTFGEVILESGNWDLIGVLRASGNVTVAPNTVLDNGGNARVRTAGSFTMDASSGLGLTGLSVGGALTVPAGTVPVDTVVFTGTGQTLPFWNGSGNVNYNSVRVTGTATALIPPSGTQALTGSLLVNGTLAFTGTTPANLTISGGLNVAGAAARLLSAGALHRLTVIGPARFDGAASTNDLSTGLLRLGGDLIQAATHSPASLVTAPGYTVELTGTGTISFATPAQSSVGTLELLNAGATRTLTSDLTVTGDLQLQSEGGSLVSNVLGAGGTRFVSAPFLESFTSTGFTLRNVGLRLRNLNLDGDLILDNFDPTVVQVDMAAPSGSAFAWGFDFRTAPTGMGRYLRATDLAPADGQPFDVTIGAPISPATHGGFAEAVGPATITGWAAATSHNWIAGTANWRIAASWSNGVVPGPADTAVVPGFANGAPFVSNGDTVRIGVLRHAGSQPIAVTGGGRVIVRDSLAVAVGSSVTCDNGAFVLSNPFDGNIGFNLDAPNCGLQILRGTARPTTVYSRVNDLWVSGTGLLHLNGRRVDATNFLVTLERGRLRMDAATDSLVVGSAVFDGESTSGLLTAGTIVVTSAFQQGNTTSATSFRATNEHRVVLQGTGVSDITMASAGAALSSFARLTILKGSTGTVNFNSSGLHATIVDVLGGTSNVTAGASLTVPGTLQGFSPAVLRVLTGGTLTVTGTCSGSAGFVQNLGGTLNASCP